MKIDSKMPITVMVTVMVLVGGFFYMKKTTPTRTYKAEIKQLKLICEHQALEIEAQKQKMEIDAIKKEIEKKTPAYKLTPKEPE